MKKTIVKAKLTNRSDLISTLAEINFHFSESYWQHDRIFVPRRYDREKSQPRLILRTIVRGKNNDASYILLLRRHVEKDLYDLVHATPVTDYAEAAYILYQLGYELKHEVSRRREELSMGETIRLYLDKIDTLDGYYLKIESDLDDRDDPSESLDDLKKTLKVLGVKNPLIKETYGELTDANAPLQ